MTYTHGHAESVLRSHRARTAENSAAYLLPYLKPDHRLLDVGSGPGTITADLAGLVREVVAVEVTQEAAEITRAGLAERGVTNAQVVVADVARLDLRRRFLRRRPRPPGAAARGRSRGRAPRDGAGDAARGSGGGP